jgi:hypothetical protein
MDAHSGKIQPETRLIKTAYRRGQGRTTIPQPGKVIGHGRRFSRGCDITLALQLVFTLGTSALD